MVLENEQRGTNRTARAKSITDRPKVKIERARADGTKGTGSWARHKRHGPMGTVQKAQVKGIGKKARDKS